MSGYVGDLSDSQAEMLAIMKQRVDDYVKVKVNDEGWELTEDQKLLLSMDSMYLRFLRGRKWDLEAAYDLYIKTSHWRRTFQGIGVEGVTEESVENELKAGKCFMYQYDKKNRTVIYIRPRLHVPSESNVKEMERFVVWTTELGRKQLKPGVETSLVVYDMNGFGMGNMDYAQVKSQINILQNYYPESMGETLIVNSPWLFSACWRLIKGWIDPVAAEKIKFVTNADLLNYIDEDKLLKEFGGKDPYEFKYQTVEERKNTDWIPPWEMPWAVEWKNDVAPSPESAEDTPNTSE